jgi:hypothetical protein
VSRLNAATICSAQGRSRAMRSRVRRAERLDRQPPGDTANQAEPAEPGEHHGGPGPLSQAGRGECDGLLGEHTGDQ